MARARRHTRRSGRAGAIAGVLALALTGATGAVGAGGPGAEAPGAAAVPGDVTGLAFDAAGRLHAADRDAARVVTLGRAGEVLAVLGAGRLQAPAGVAVAPGGDVLVADAGGVQRFGPDGTPAGGFAARAPASVAVAADGTIYVSEPDRVARFSPFGLRLGDWPAADPRGLAVAADGSVWVAVVGALARFGATGAPLSVTPADDPEGVAVAPDGTVLVAERNRDRLARVSADGARIGEIDGFEHPHAVAVDCRGTVAVGDASRARIHRIVAGGAPPPCVAAAVAPAPAAVVAAPAVPAAVAAVPQAAAEPDRPVARRPPAVPQAAVPQPVLGASAIAGAVAGTVLVRRPGERELAVLTAGARLAMGTIIDARAGRVRLAFASDTADFDRLGTTQTADVDSGLFSIHQAPRRSGVELRLRGALPACGRPAYARPVGPRHLWAEVSGQFTTRGRRASATATGAGARWLTEDRCDGTLVRVTRGAADVRDRTRGRTVGVRAGARHLARPRGPDAQRAPRTAG